MRGTATVRKRRRERPSSRPRPSNGQEGTQLRRWQKWERYLTEESEAEGSTGFNTVYRTTKRLPHELRAFRPLFGRSGTLTGNIVSYRRRFCRAGSAYQLVFT